MIEPETVPASGNPPSRLARTLQVLTRSRISAPSPGILTWVPKCTSGTCVISLEDIMQHRPQKAVRKGIRILAVPVVPLATPKSN